MTTMTLAEIARTRRVKALASLAEREDTLFDLSKQRVRALRASAVPVFRTNRVPASGNVVAIDLLREAA